MTPARPDDREHLSLALEAAGLGEWTWDAATDGVTCSPRAARIFGIEPGRVITWADMRHLLHPEDREPARTAVEAALTTSTDYITQYRVISGPRERWIAVSGHGTYDEAGAVTGMVGVVHDRTRERMLATLDERLRALSDPKQIMERASAYLGDYLDADRCAYATLAEDQDTFTVLGDYARSMPSLTGTYRFRQFSEACLRMLRADQPWVVSDCEIDPRITPADLEAYHHIQIRGVIGVPVHKNGRFVAAMAVHVTAPRNWSAEDIETVQRVASRCWESIERARIEAQHADLLAQAEAANRAKDHFLAVLGHELRNPLAPMVLVMDLLNARNDPTSERERKIIGRQLGHMMRLVDDLMDVSRLSRGKVTLQSEPLEVRDCIEQALETCEPVLASRQHPVALSVAPDLYVMGDPVRLRQVLANLLHNASKFTPADRRIAVTAQRVESQVWIEVEDAGVGIAADLLPTIFDSFVQGHQARDRASGGLGLGLAIARGLVEQHGGELQGFSDGVGRGSRFRVALPLHDPALSTCESPQHRDGSAPEAAPAPPARCLIVDDNRDGADALAAGLSQLGYDVDVDYHALAALRRCETALPDAAVLDLGLPDVDGFELARRIRALPGGQQVRLIALSGYAAIADRQAAIEAGFDFHLVKPTDLAAVSAVLTRPRT